MELMKLKYALKRLGFSPEVKGYEYAIYAIMKVARQGANKRMNAAEMYRMIAKEFNTKPAAVERCIRNAIESAWLKGDADFSEEIFQSSISAEKGKPTNLQFIYTMPEYIINQKK